MSRTFTVPLPALDKIAFVLANGPSLGGVDLQRLPDVPTFGMNAAYRHWQRIGWFPTHFACLDEIVGLSHADALAAMIRNLTATRPGSFLLRRNLITRLGLEVDGRRVIDFDQLALTSRSFARTPVTTGSHALIWALTLGFEMVFLLGADCSYVEVVAGAENRGDNVLEIVREAANPNYFIADYQRVGDRFHVPNIGGATHMRSWRAAAAVAAERGVQVYNLAPNSHIDVFDFAQLQDVLAGDRFVVSPAETRVGFGAA